MDSYMSFAQTPAQKGHDTHQIPASHLQYNHSNFQHSVLEPALPLQSFLGHEPPWHVADSSGQASATADLAWRCWGGGGNESGSEQPWEVYVWKAGMRLTLEDHNNSV